MELGKAIEHEIKIKPSANKGFIVEVGCGTFVFETKQRLVVALAEYLDDPKKFEKEYDEKVDAELPRDKDINIFSAIQPLGNWSTKFRGEERIV